MSKRIYLLLCSLLYITYPASGQTFPDSAIPVDTAALNLITQMLVFPQEKIYLQTDRPYYTAGEKIFYRAYLLNACLHTPEYLSRYIYVELVNPFDSVEIRKQIRPEEGGLFHNAMTLPERLPQGYYRLRAYTRFMENAGEYHFYSKPVYIAANQDSIRMEITDVRSLNERQTSVRLRFLNIKTNGVMRPEKINCQLNGKKAKTVKPDKNGQIELKLDLPGDSPERDILVEYLAKDNLFKEYRIINREQIIFRQFEKIPYTEKKVNLSFYPEGGHVVENWLCRIAFKALFPDGSAAHVSGRIVDSEANGIEKLQTIHDGMGFFNLRAERGKTYYAEFECEGRTFRAPLPEFKYSPLALKTRWKQDHLLIALNRLPGTPLPKLYLLIHCRGNAVYFREWNNTKDVLSVEEKVFPSGVSHILLLTEDFQPVSERLVFLNKKDNATAEIVPGKPSYGRREHTKMNIILKSGKPDTPINTGISDTVPPGFSISVTDDREVVVDTTSNILSEILLTSDLKGHIVNPSWYLGDDPEAVSAADLLMLTHGWTRYDIPGALRGEFQAPEILPERSQSFTGTVGIGFNRAAKKMNVSLLSYNNHEKYFDMTETDEKGQYRFENFEFPDSSVFFIQALKPKGGKYTLELYPEPVSYPGISGGLLSAVSALPWTEDPVFEEYISKKETYVYEDGMRVIELPEVTVTGKRKRIEKYPGSYKPDYFLTDDDIKKIKPTSIGHLIRLLPNASIFNNTISFLYLNGAYKSEMRPVKAIIINGNIFRMNDLRDIYGKKNTHFDLLSLIELDDIGQINVVNKMDPEIYISSVSPDDIEIKDKSLDEEGVILEIITKSGRGLPRGRRFNICMFYPLGYSKPVEFYSPKYDTPEALNSEKTDLRTTIYWKPNVTVNSDGKASVDFYTADTPGSYSAVIEGVCPDGTLIYEHKKALIKVE